MATAGTLTQRGGKETFLGIGVDTGELEKQLFKLRRVMRDIKVQREIHASAAHLFKQEMKNNIKDHLGPKYIKVRRKPQKGWNVERGTMRRSVDYWLINERDSSYWVGPRVGLKVSKRYDAWYANIVEGDDQYIKGNNRNKDVFARSIKNKMPMAQKLMILKYKKRINVAVGRSKPGKQLKLF